MRRPADRLLAAAVAAGVAAALVGTAPARAAGSGTPAPTPSPSALPSDSWRAEATAPPSAAPAPRSGISAAIGQLTDLLVTPLRERVDVAAVLVVSAGPGASRVPSAATLEPGGGSQTTPSDWHPKGPIKVPKAVSVPPPTRRPTKLTKEQIIWAAYESAARSEATRCHLPTMLLAAIGEVESSSLRGRSLDAHHDAVPPVYGPALAGGSYPAMRDTDGGRLDGDPVWDRAVGPMQFIPATWRIWGADGNGDGVEDPQNIEDAALAAAHYLCAGGRDLSRAADRRAAVYSYNHSTRYVDTVLGIVEAVLSGADAGP